MTDLDGRIVSKGGDRLFDALWQIQQLLSCIMQAGLSIHQIEKRPEGAASVFISKQFNKSAIMQIDGVIALSFNDRMPLSTWVDFYEMPGFVIGPERSFERLFDLAISGVFASFYHRYNDWLHKNVSKRPSEWPDVLQFARLVRNAIAHDGRTRIRGEREVGARWHHLDYGPERDGERIIGPVLSAGDLLILMVEASRKLDSLLAPIDP